MHFQIGISAVTSFMFVGRLPFTWQNILLPAVACCRAGCIEAQILVLDGTPTTGYRSFLNFFSTFVPADLTAVDATLKAASARAMQTHKSAKCAHWRKHSVPVLAALHHPLGVSRYPAESAAKAATPFARLHELLAFHNVSMVVSGHLHDAFGPRLHGYHHLQPSEWLPSDARLLEAESADWKFRRRFRLITMLDGMPSFTDLRFIGSTRQADGVRVPAAVWHVRPEDKSAAASPFIIHIIEPPDARYFPARSGSAGYSLSAIQAYIIPARADNAPALSSTAVAADLTCSDIAGTVLWVQRAPLVQAASSVHNEELACSSRKLQLASAELPRSLLAMAQQCQAAGHSLHLQVSADAGELGTAKSDLRPIQATSAAGAQHLPLGTTLVESFTVAADWQKTAARWYTGSLALVLALLIVSRLARQTLRQAARALTGASALARGASTVLPGVCQAGRSCLYFAMGMHHIGISQCLWCTGASLCNVQVTSC